MRKDTLRTILTLIKCICVLLKYLAVKGILLEYMTTR